MSRMDEYRAAKRADKAADAEQARRDADAASARRIRERAELAEQSRKDAAMREEQARKDRTDREAKRSARWAAVTAFAVEHKVSLLIYPLAIASAVMAIPSMAAYGTQVYGNATGAVLPVLSELGMWAFAFAVHARRQHPDRPVWALLLGVWTFAAIGFGINLMHGLDRGVSSGVVMGIASIAGVVAHQLVTASAVRSRAQRRAARIERKQAAKVERIRRAAVRHAVAEIDADGHAALVFTPGHYVLGTRGRLTEAIVPRLPVEPEPALSDRIGDEASAWLATQDRPALDTGSTEEDRGPIATLDRGSDQRKSRRRKSIPPRTARSIDTLRRELREAIAADPDGLDPTKAESIRRVLRCSPARARQLRDDYRKDGA